MKNLTKTLFAFFAVLGMAAMMSACHKDKNNYSMDNQDFVTRASSSNMFEIAAGNMAISKSSNADVKAYGTHMVTAHSGVATEMSNLVANKSLNIPTAMTAEDQANLNAMSSLSGTAFDKQFAAMMITSHQKTIALFQSASSDTGVPDGDLRNFAAGKLPDLNEHLQGATALQVKVGK